MTEIVADNMKYDYNLGRDGGRFVLFPLTGFHTEEDVILAKKELRRDHDVVSINTEWKEWNEWKRIKVWLHMIAIKNNEANDEFHKFMDICRKEKSK